MEAVKVCARIRPKNEAEVALEERDYLSHTDAKITASTSKGYTNDFSFSSVMNESCTNKDVYESVMEPLVDAAFEGINGCLLAYGQTGSGKTYTVLGPNSLASEGKDRGVLPRALDAIFLRAAQLDKAETVEVRIGALEIYNNKVFDLLRNKKVSLMSSAGSTIITGGTQIRVTNAKEAKAAIKGGIKMRRTAATNMNKNSSRSHFVTLLTIVRYNSETAMFRASQLYIVDLAGSERATKTGTNGERLAEAGKINQSLLTLGVCIDKILANKRHVPFRDSNLTRLLQNSLGGSSLCSVIINISPALYNETETLNTLRFGARTQMIQNCPTVNAQRTPEELKKLLGKHMKTVSQNRQTLADLDDELAQLESLFRMAKLRRSSLRDLRDAGHHSNNTGGRGEEKNCAGYI